jgi:hypothetical protein
VHIESLGTVTGCEAMSNDSKYLMLSPLIVIPHWLEVAEMVVARIHCSKSEMVVAQIRFFLSLI